MNAAVDLFRIHSGALTFLPISSTIRMPKFIGISPIQDFTSARFSSSRCSIIIDRNCLDLRSVVVGVFHERQPTKHFP